MNIDAEWLYRRLLPDATRVVYERIVTLGDRLKLNCQVCIALGIRALAASLLLNLIQVIL